MYVPPNYADGGNHPFILFMHGIGERGTDNVSQVNSNIDGLLEEAKRRGAFLYAPQSPTATWGSAALSPTLAVQRAITMMRTAETTYPGIDDNRLYVTGLSAGGGGAWDILGSYPQTFAAGAPICGTLGLDVFFASLKDENIWTAHARNDSVVAVSTTRNMVNAIFNAGHFPIETFPPLDSPDDASYSHGKLQYYEPAVGDHQIWEVTYRQPGFYDWMFAQALPEPTAALAASLLLLAGAARTRRRPSLRPTKGGRRKSPAEKSFPLG
jgi:predicted peptidase